MLKIQGTLIILTCLIFSIGWKAPKVYSDKIDSTKSSALKAPSNLDIVESLPEILKENDDSAESLVFKNDRLIVRKTLIESDQVGGQIAYNITLEAMKDIENLWIEELIPESFKVIQVIPHLDNTDELIWHFQDLEAGDTQAIAFNIKPMDQGTHEARTLVRFEQSMNLVLFSGQPRLELDLIAPDLIERNTSDTWEISVRNTGTAVANLVNLSANFSKAFKEISPVSYSLDSLDIGASRTFQFKAKALKQGLFENNFFASYNGSIPETEALIAANTQIVQSGIQIETINPRTAYVFKPHSYKINIRNTGDTDLKNVHISQILSQNYSIIDSGFGRINGNAIGWMIPHLPAGSTQLITTLLTSNRPGDAIVKTILKTQNEITASDQASTKWLAVPGVTLSISDSKDPITLGEKTELRIRVRNQGEFEPVKGQIDIKFSKHLKPISILNDIKGTISGNSIIIPTVLLQPGKDIIIDVLAEGIEMGSGRTNLSFIADFLNDPVINQESTNIY